MKIGYIACSAGIRDVLCYSMDILFLCPNILKSKAVCLNSIHFPDFIPISIGFHSLLPKYQKNLPI